MISAPQPGGYADIETGEVVDFVAVPRSAHRSYHRGAWFVSFAAAFDQIADEAWPAGDYQVLVKLMGRLEFDNWVQVNVTALAGEMGRSRQKTSAAISRLVKRGVLTKGPRSGNTNSYQLNTDIAFRGSAESRRRVQREMDRRNMQVIAGDNRPDEQALPGDQALPGL